MEQSDCDVERLQEHSKH